jgi:hypothetical protein
MLAGQICASFLLASFLFAKQQESIGAGQIRPLFERKTERILSKY